MSRTLCNTYTLWPWQRNFWFSCYAFNRSYTLAGYRVLLRCISLRFNTLLYTTTLLPFMFWKMPFFTRFNTLARISCRVTRKCDKAIRRFVNLNLWRCNNTKDELYSDLVLMGKRKWIVNCYEIVPRMGRI